MFVVTPRVAQLSSDEFSVIIALFEQILMITSSAARLGRSAWGKLIDCVRVPTAERLTSNPVALSTSLTGRRSDSIRGQRLRRASVVYGEILRSGWGHSWIGVDNELIMKFYPLIQLRFKPLRLHTTLSCDDEMPPDFFGIPWYHQTLICPSRCDPQSCWSWWWQQQSLSEETSVCGQGIFYLWASWFTFCYLSLLSLQACSNIKSTWPVLTSIIYLVWFFFSKNAYLYMYKHTLFLCL